MSNVTYLSQEGYDNLVAQLDDLKTRGRTEAAKAIAEAREKGDLSENAEYDAAKEAQGILETKIAKLKNVIANGRVIDDSEIDNTKVYILSTAKIKNMANGQEMIFTIVAENEADLKAKKISIDSPFGKGLLGKSVGEIADIITPNGTMKFEVLEITR